jgi:hypothetical protein
MSWHLPVGPVRLDSPDAVAKAADAALAGLRAKGSSHAAQFDAPEVRREVAGQVEAAIGAAVELLGGLGDPAEVHVTLSGHANPGHESKLGWPNDTITVTVTRATSAG